MKVIINMMGQKDSVKHLPAKMTLAAQRVILRRMAPWQAVARDFSSRLTLSGFDLPAPFSTASYNTRVSPEYRLPDFGRSSGSLAVLVGASRSLWKPFVEGFRTDPSLQASPHPVDDYSEEVIRRAAESVNHPHELRWPHFRKGHRVAIQAAAEVAGLAKTSPSYLSVHPVHGPWISFRGVAIFDTTGPDATALPPLADTCTGCLAPCMEVLERALKGVGPVTSVDGPLPNWPEWVTIRDACPVGRASRYSDQQVRYHYGKDRSDIRLP